MKRQDREGVLPYNNMDKLWGEASLVNRADMKSSFLTDTVTNDLSFVMVDEMVQHAIQDATQSCDLPLRGEALAWLWVCCPDIADQLPLPGPGAVDVQQKAVAYLDRYPAY